MRRVIKGLQIVADDDWIYPADAASPTPQGTPGARRILPLAQFLAQFSGAASAPGAAARGVQLAPPDDVALLAPYLQHADLVAVEFTSVGEGRGYTQGRLLRERHGFKGELRAVGAAKRDQLYFLARCGFDAFDLPTSEDLDAALEQLHRFSVAYQRTTGGLLHPSGRAP